MCNMFGKTMRLALNFDHPVQWKYGILGFYFKQNTKIYIFLNTFYDLFSIHYTSTCKYKMLYGLQNKVEQETILVSYVKNNLEN